MRRRWPSRPGRRPAPSGCPPADPGARGRPWRPPARPRLPGASPPAGPKPTGRAPRRSGPGPPGALPAGDVLALCAGLVAQQRRLGQQPVGPRGAGLPPLQLVGEGQATEGRQRQQRRGQAELEPAPPPLLGGSGLGAGPLDLGGAEPLLHAGQVRRDPLADGPGVARPVGRLGGQAVAGQGHQLGVGPAGVEPSQGLGRVAAGGLALGLGRGPAGERGRAGQDLAEDRAQGEDVGPLVHRVDLAPGLLRRHVGRACPAPSRPATAPRPGRSCCCAVAMTVSRSGSRPAAARHRRPRRGAAPWPGPSPSPGPRRTSRP